MMDQGLDRHFLHIGHKGLCHVPSLRDPTTTFYEVNVVQQVCSNVMCCGVRCKHIRSDSNMRDLAKEVISKEGLFFDENEESLVILDCGNEISSNGEHQTVGETFSIKQNACTCIASSFGLKCLAQFCWEQMKDDTEVQTQPLSDREGYPPEQASKHYLRIS